MAASVGTALSAPWTEQLFEDDFVIVAHQGHPILAAETLAPRDMTGFEWALVSSSGVRSDRSTMHFGPWG
ncbi:hypothetical protein CK228_18530 [Mesorhizobium sp. WSM4312]|nr:hypothetical protein CK228_18530 [Mesorhizobium sp. WSM4312]